MKKHGKGYNVSGSNGIIWITKDEIRHWRSGKLIKRKDGQPFRIPVRRKSKR